MSLNANDVKYVINTMIQAVEENREYLTDLDSAIGDADHGTNLSKGFHAVDIKLKNYNDEDIGGLLKTVGMTLISTVGGASGPLYGTAFMKAGAAVAGKAEVDMKDLISMVQAGIDGIKMRGKAKIGDKTMVDAIEPALNMLIEKYGLNLPSEIILMNARDAAKIGAESTIGIEAKKGRASYLGERSIGHQDPGATSSYIMLNSIYESYIKLKIKID